MALSNDVVFLVNDGIDNKKLKLSSLKTGLEDTFLPLTGGNVTGPVTVPTPSNPNDVAPKRYVDGEIQVIQEQLDSAIEAVTDGTFKYIVGTGADPTAGEFYFANGTDYVPAITNVKEIYISTTNIEGQTVTFADVEDGTYLRFNLSGDLYLFICNAAPTFSSDSVTFSVDLIEADGSGPIANDQAVVSTLHITGIDVNDLEAQFDTRYVKLSSSTPQDINSDITFSGDMDFGGDVHIGELDFNSNTSAGIWLTIENNATGIIAQAPRTMVAATNGFELLRGTTEVFSVDYSGSGEFAGNVTVGEYKNGKGAALSDVLSIHKDQYGTDVIQVDVLTGPVADRTVTITGSGSATFAGEVNSDIGFVHTRAGIGNANVGSSSSNAFSVYDANGNGPLAGIGWDGSSTFAGTGSFGNEVYINGSQVSTQRYLNFVDAGSSTYRATLRRDAWYLGTDVSNIGDVTPGNANIILNMNGSATLAGELQARNLNVNFRQQRSGPVFQGYAGTAGEDPALFTSQINSDGAASFAGGAFAIESNGHISTNVKSQGNIELDSTGFFTNTKIKLWAITGNADFAGDITASSGVFYNSAVLSSKNTAGIRPSLFITGYDSSGTSPSDLAFRLRIQDDLSSPAAAHRDMITMSYGGSATFASQVTSRDLVVQQTDDTFPVYRGLAVDGTITSRIDGDGSAEFADRVTAKNFLANGDQVTSFTAYTKNASNNFKRFTVYNTDTSQNSVSIFGDGSATFAGDIQSAGEVYSSFQFKARSTGDPTSAANVFTGLNYSGTQTFSVSGAGAATFASSIDISGGIGAADGYGTTVSEVGVAVRNDNGSKTYIFKGLKGGTAASNEVVSINNDGSAEFAGDVFTPNSFQLGTGINRSYKIDTDSGNWTENTINFKELDSNGNEYTRLSIIGKGVSNSTAVFSGSAEFAGTVTANGTILTRASGDLDVGERLEKADTALKALKVAAAAASDFDALKSAIATALADI